ncbi:E3 ubiquitin-protein ligase RFWD3 [Thraustotheca clavata]|uniref:RING-type E3 ubiquitin transferase n=1 Tax=Thraustotheca clavata TaxID=74557 RepID=A0A1V9YM92_9STRA|nr:E3 ubiquitin-protein ligase RFWD3 [Thraustotheca clavata]
MESPSKKRRRQCFEAVECTICCEHCTTNGEHRLASLACGHFFGQSCIERWVKTSKTCPVCNRAVKRNDVRVHFTDTIAAIDNSLQEEYIKKYQNEKKTRTQAEMEVASLKLQLKIAKQEADTQKQRIMELLEENSSLKAKPIVLSDDSDDDDANEDEESESSWDYVKATDVVVPCIEARVCAFSSNCDMICVGTRTQVSSGQQAQYGLLQVSTLDVHHRVTMALHKSPVRDLAFSHDDGMIASTAFDAKLYFSSTKAHTPVLKYDMQYPGWSCTWDVSNPFTIYCGHHNGHISIFDIRRTGAPLNALAHQHKQPIHSIRTMQHGSSKTIVAATFSGLSMWHVNNGSALTPEPSLNMEIKNCSAMSHNQITPNQLVVSTRTQGPMNPAQHFMLTVQKNEHGQLETISDSVLQGHRTPSALSRPATWTMPHQGSPIVASSDEDSKQVWLWETATSSIVKKINPGLSTSIVDVQHGIIPNPATQEGRLAVLCNKGLVIYKSTFSRRSSQRN